MGAAPSTSNIGSTGPRLSKIADFEPIIACSASAITPSEKSSITGCLQLLEILEILEISWNLKFLLEILEISWIFIDAPGKIYN